jgi:hypothetical protein
MKNWKRLWYNGLPAYFEIHSIHFEWFFTKITFADVLPWIPLVSGVPAHGRCRLNFLVLYQEHCAFSLFWAMYAFIVTTVLRAIPELNDAESWCVYVNVF